MKYHNEAKLIDNSDINSTYKEAEKVLKRGVSDNTSIMEAYRLGEKLKYDALPSLDGDRREVVSSLTMAEGYRDRYLRDNHCTHEEAISNPVYAGNERYIQSLKDKKADIEAKIIDVVEVSTALHDQIPMADSDCKFKVINNKNGTLTIERSWINGKKSEYLHEGTIRNSETSFYRNVFEKKDAITMGQNSNSVYAHQFSFQYRGLGYKRETTLGGEGVKLKNSVEGGLLNFDASFGYKRGIQGKMPTLSVDANGSLAQLKDTASFVVKDKEYAKFSAEVSALKTSASVKTNSIGIVKMSTSSHILGGKASAQVSGVTVAKVGGSLGEEKISMSTLDVLKTPKESEQVDHEKTVIVAKASVSLGNETSIVREEYSSLNEEWENSNIVEQIGKDASSFVDGLRSHHLDINTDTVESLVEDYQAIQEIKDKGFGVDVSEKPIVIGNSGLKNAIFENGFYNQGQNDLGALGTCGPTSIANSLNRVIGTAEYTENSVLHNAMDNNLCFKSDDPYLCGGTTTKEVVNIINNVKSPESNIHTEVYEYDKALSVDQLADKLDDSGTVAMVGVDSATLWDQRGDVSNTGLFQHTESQSDHWITVDSPIRDDAGNVTGFNIIDSGGGVSEVSREKFEAMYQGNDEHTISDPTAILISNSGEVENTYCNISEGIERTSNYKGSAMESDEENLYAEQEVKKEFEKKFCDWKETWVTDKKAEQFINTSEIYAKKAVDSEACKSIEEFYKMYISRDYEYSQDFIARVKKPYLDTGASALVSKRDIMSAFDDSRWQNTIGRQEHGNFVTSMMEDMRLIYNEDGSLKSPNIIAEIKGVNEDKYDEGVYQYSYDPEFVKNCEEKGLIRTANGDTPGASSVNIPGCQTWAGEHIEYSESELLMPSIYVEGYESSDVFKDIAERGYFEIKDPEVVTVDGDKVQVKGSFKINLIS